MTPLFKDRTDAGRKLAEKLLRYANRPEVIVLGLPRGGIPVAYEVANALNAPLDIYLVRKLGVPGHEELAMGAIASGGIRVLNEDVVRILGIPEEAIDYVATIEQRELERRARSYRDGRPEPQLQGKIVILVDDGLATGATMRAAIQALRTQNPARIVVAVPTSDPEICESLGREVDEIVCAFTPKPFMGVGLWYRDFSQTSDQEVRYLLSQAAQLQPVV
jgi:putative phosphoribosyl transferase